ncbi:uncharacterized protein At4g13200, chloroplastic [Actinidia eriantha]|uniref:uncharacterized protein At4g13200, chloroplastic n=1 Tax=Actinidia eriantha TaxID=165200 RepID=UPI002587FA43|nr:uncharacterized protein At4g13200, chloroplastic [Actinidia eriantha]
MTGGALSASPPSSTTYSRIPSTTQNCPFSKPSWVSSVAIPRLSREHHHHLSSSDSKVKPTRLIRFRCNSSTGPGSSGSDDGDSRSVLDAFFLGKALAEALNERIESTVGEFLSTIGRLQAEQQKQVQDFQEEVLERAKRAKEKAAREAMEAQGPVSKPSTLDVSTAINGDATTNLSSAKDAATPAISPSSYSLSTGNIDANADADPTDTDPL